MIYVGKHSTKNIDDGYLGSGTYFQRAIKKHGKQNFERYDLAFFSSLEEVLLAELKIVDDEVVNDENTYNLTTGGKSGFTEESQKLGNLTLWKDSEFRVRKSKEVSIRNKKLHAEGRLRASSWLGRQHKNESKTAIGVANSITQAGKKNSQFGTVWVSHLDLKVSKKIKSEELEQCISDGWFKGRKMKWC